MGFVWGGCDSDWGQRSHFRVTHTSVLIRTFLYCWFTWEVYIDLEDENRLVPFGGQKPFMSIVWRKLLLHDLFSSQTQQSRCWYKRRLNLFGVFIPSEWTDKCLGLEKEFSIELGTFFLMMMSFFYYKVMMDYGFFWKVKNRGIKIT